MSCLIAQMKGRRRSYVKVLSNETIFTLPADLNRSIPYEASHILDEDEWFRLENFSTKDFCLQLLTDAFNSADYAQAVRQDFHELRFLCYYDDSDGNEVFHFQKLSTNKVLLKKWISSIDDEPSFIQNKPIIIIEDIPHAIYDKNADVLYFRNLSLISSIFHGIDTLYREATQEETENFLQNDFILTGPNFSADSVKKANRKRIAMAMNTLNGYTPEDRTNVCVYIRDYCGNLQYDENAQQFSISTEEELKQLLYGIEERYYTTLRGNERRLASSVRRIDYTSANQENISTNSI